MRKPFSKRKRGKIKQLHKRMTSLRRSYFVGKQLWCNNAIFMYIHRGRTDGPDAHSIRPVCPYAAIPRPFLLSKEFVDATQVFAYTAVAGIHTPCSPVRRGSHGRGSHKSAYRRSRPMPASARPWCASPGGSSVRQESAGSPVRAAV